MKNNMEEIDQLIKETLSNEEAAFYDSLEQQGLFEMIFGLFKGKNAWFLIIANIIALVFIGLLVYCGNRFLQVETTEELVRWGLGVVICLSFVCMIKIYGWMQMDKQAILREMKRLELQVMSLSGKIGN